MKNLASLACLILPLAASLVVLLGACSGSDAGSDSPADGGAGGSSGSTSSSGASGTTSSGASGNVCPHARALDCAPGGDGGNEAGDASVVLDDHFVTEIVSYTAGMCAGFGQAELPGVVEGPPHGGGISMGGTDVLSLGKGGTIVVGFGTNGITDAAGPDFIVFENAFNAGGDASMPFAELGEVSVSEDGATWHTFPCTATAYPYGTCAGWHPVYSSPDNGISARDPSVAGGDAFDLADLGVSHARFVRIVDKTTATCSGTSGGFDLDAVAVVHADH